MSVDIPLVGKMFENLIVQELTKGYEVEPLIQKKFYEEIGKKGGEAVKAKRGRPFYEEIGKKGGEVVRAERGRTFYEEIGRKGGETIKAERGTPFYEEIGRKGAQKVRLLVMRGKDTQSRG